MMRITKIYSKTNLRDGVFIEIDNKDKFLVSGSYLAELKVKLINTIPAMITIDDNPLAISSEENKNVKIINTYNTGVDIPDEDYKAVIMVCGE